MGQAIELSSLREFLYDTLKFTEELKNVLKFNCNEATFSLKPWSVETFVKRGIDESNCICSKNTTETEMEEIAAGISRTLLQTQELREKLSLTIIKQKKCGKQSSTSDIYGVALTNKCSTKKLPRLQKNSTSSIDSNSNERRDNKTTNFCTEKKKYSRNPKCDNLIVSQKQKGGPSQGVKTNSCKNSIKAKDDNRHLIKSGKKDFLAINKSNIKTMKPVEHHPNINEKSKLNSKFVYANVQGKSDNTDRRSASTSELKTLIQKVSLESNSCTSTSETEKINCPLHGDVAPQFIYEKNSSTMDVVESLDRFTVPGEIMKTLKAYHTYLTTLFSNELSNNPKKEKMIDKFLGEFKSMNNNARERFAQKTDFMNSSTNFILSFQNLLSKNIALTSLDNVERTNARLSFRQKIDDAKEFDIAKVTRSRRQHKLYDKFNLQGWMSNGIWNCNSIRNLKGTTGACCIRYTNKDHLLEFFDVIQRLQQTQYFNDLMDMILQDLILNLRKSFNPSNSDCIQIYKMISILCQGLNPRVPVLVKTDD